MTHKLARHLLLVLIITPAAIFAQVPLGLNPIWQSTPEDVYSTGLIWEDINRDGYIDLVISNGNDIVIAPNHIYLSQYGVLPVTPTWSSQNSAYSGHCAVGDIDDNGFPDLVVANYISNEGFSKPALSDMYMNLTGTPNRVPDWHPKDSFYSFSCALGDIDNDGDLDLAFATGEGYNGHAETDKIYLNENGFYADEPSWESADVNFSMDVTFGDVDNDGDLDMAVCDHESGASIYYNTGGLMGTAPSWHSFDWESANTVVFGDVNGDGWLDLVVAFNNQIGPGGYYRVYFNNGLGTPYQTAGWVSSDGGYGSALALYDYDTDGDLDLAAGRWFDKPRVYENLGTAFTTAPVWRADIAQVVEELAWADMDGDGVEQLADTILSLAGKKLFYLKYGYLNSVDSVLADGVILEDNAWCYDLVSGWVSLAEAPVTSLIIYYQYSYKCDLTISNWDTFNKVYGNTRSPYIEFAADVSQGWKPLTVQFTDNSAGGSNQFWQFGDGEVSSEADPLHTFDISGAFDVRLDATVAGGPHNHTEKKMVVVLDDTLYFPDIQFRAGDTIKVPVYLKNSQPLEYFVLPLYHGGDMELEFYDYDTDSCRTDYFDDVRPASVSALYSKLTITFDPAVTNVKPPLPPGFGRLINLYFIHRGGSGANVLDTTTLNQKVVRHYAGYIDYAPRVRAGLIEILPFAKGDCNNDGAIDILDILMLINYKFKGGPAPDLYQGDINCDDYIDILDIIYLINYKFKGGPAPDCG